MAKDREKKNCEKFIRGYEWVWSKESTNICLTHRYSIKNKFESEKKKNY